MRMPRPAFYIFKCEHSSSSTRMKKPSCVNENTKDLFQHLSMKLTEKGLISTVLPIKTACLNRCKMGPVMLVEPGHYMYVYLTKEKIDRIVTEHILGGKVVQEFVIDAGLWDEPISPADMKQQMGM